MTERKLHRSLTKKKIAGVCGGLSDYFDLDVSLIRVLLVAMVVLGCGSGIILYLLCWLIIPEEPYY